MFERFDSAGHAFDLRTHDVVDMGNGTGASLSTVPHTALAAPSSIPIAHLGPVSNSIPLGAGFDFRGDNSPGFALVLVYIAPLAPARRCRRRCSRRPATSASDATRR